MSKKELEKILLSKIERLEAFEERMKVRLDNLTIKINDIDEGNLTLFGELHPRDGGTELKEKINLMCVIYNAKGEIIKKDQYNTLYPEDFFGFEVFNFDFYEDGIIHEIGAIRIYPTK